ncbi:MAG: hypothetical protein SGBAC_003066 [Bacillariaceae sp.]
MVPLLQILFIFLLLISKADSRSTKDPSFTIKLPPFEQFSNLGGEEDAMRSGVFSHGREYKVFGSSSSTAYRGGGNASRSSEKRDFVEMYRRYGLPGEYASNEANDNWKTPELFRGVQNWWRTSISPKLENLPRIVCRVEPTTTLKLRKSFRPLGTIVQMGADFNTQRGVWQFKSSWEEPIIGGKLTLIGNELHITKSWRLYVGTSNISFALQIEHENESTHPIQPPSNRITIIILIVIVILNILVLLVAGAVEDLVTRLRFRAAINLQTFQAYARVGFRTERLSPINVMEGFTILKRLPLDGYGGNVKLEVKANVALPEPEIEYSTETQQRSLIGMGDVEVSIDEMNLLLDY